jgi:hypothetical protein
MGIKVKKTVDGWMVVCPACKRPHHFDSRWSFNGNHEAPTFRDSMLVRTGNSDAPEICHSYMTDGVWSYLHDCTHELKGKTVEAPDWQSA